MTIPTELLYLVVGGMLAWLLYRYFSGHDGTQVRRPDYAGLPHEGSVEVRHHLVRWRAAHEHSFVAAWQLESGHLVSMRVVLDETDPEDPDRGHLDVRIDRREQVRHAEWTDRIRDRTLRADVEAILRALQREAATARSDRTRLAAARPVGPAETVGPAGRAGPADDERVGRG